MNARRLTALLLLCILLILPGCSPSPTAITVGGSRVDASEFAFYLRNNSDGHDDGTPFSDEETALAREAAVDQIVTAEVVRLKCRELGLTLSREQKDALKAQKDAIIQALGGKAAYLTYLRESSLTDRAYDKMQENALYYEMLCSHIYDETEYTDEALRQFFADSYLTLKYLRFPTVDGLGQPLSDEVIETTRAQADRLLMQALADPSCFDELITTYGGAANGSTGGIVGRLEAVGIDYMEAAFLLESGEIDGLYECADGYYILQRLPVDATYYENNRDYIRQAALDWAFAQQLDDWKAHTTYALSKAGEKITLNNYSDYVK